MPVGLGVLSWRLKPHYSHVRRGHAGTTFIRRLVEC